MTSMNVMTVPMTVVTTHFVSILMEPMNASVTKEMVPNGPLTMDQLNAICKVGCLFPMVGVSILPIAEVGPNDHREDAPHFNFPFRQS